MPMNSEEISKTLKALKAASDFRKRHMSFLKSMEDVDLVREIGLNQASGHPITLKLLLLHGIASFATVQRRLSRLRRIGVLLQVRSEHDKRIMTLILSPPVWKAYIRLGRQMRKIWA